MKPSQNSAMPFGTQLGIRSRSGAFVGAAAESIGQVSVKPGVSLAADAR